MHKRHDSARADYDDIPERRKPYSQGAFALGLFSLIALGTFIGGVVALPLALTGWALSSRELAAINRGELDPVDEHLIRSGKTMALICLYTLAYISIVMGIIILFSKLRLV